MVYGKLLIVSFYEMWVCPVSFAFGCSMLSRFCSGMPKACTTTFVQHFAGICAMPKAFRVLVNSSKELAKRPYLMLLFISFSDCLIKTSSTLNQINTIQLHEEPASMYERIFSWERCSRNFVKLRSLLCGMIFCGVKTSFVAQFINDSGKYIAAGCIRFAPSRSWSRTWGS